MSRGRNADFRKRSAKARTGVKMEYNKLVSGEALSKEKFLTPSKEFGNMPFWFWNGEMK